MGVRAVVVCVLVAAVGFAQPPDSDRVVAQLVEELGDPVFATREKAQRELWKRGTAVVPALEKALKSDDPEVVRRARELLDKFAWGILPDTPPDVLKLLRQFQAGSADRTKTDAVREAALVALLEKGRPGRAIVRAILAKDIPEATRKPVIAHLNTLLRREAPLLMFDGKADEAADLINLHALGTTPEGAADYTAFRVLTGTLPAAIAEAEAGLKTARNPAAAKLLLAHLYRANGEWAKARAAAAEQPRVVDALLEGEGNWAALIGRPVHEGPNMPDALELSLLRLAGRADEFEKGVRRVVGSIQGVVGRDEVRDAAFALLLNNKAPEATKLLLEHHLNLGLLCEALIAQMRYKEALALIEPGRAGDAIPTSEALEFNLRRARILMLMGRRDDGSQVFAQVAEGYRQPQPDNPQDYASIPIARRSILRAELRSGLRDLALEHAAGFLTADGLTGPDGRGGETVFEVLFGTDSTAGETLYWALREKKIPGDAAGGTMKRVRDLLAGVAPVDAVEEAVKVIRSLPPPPEIIPTENRRPPFPANTEPDARTAVNRHLALAAVCRAARRDAEAEKEYVAAAELAKSGSDVAGPRSWVYGTSDASRPWVELADFLSDRDRFADAAAKLEAGFRRFPDQPLLLFLSGRALVKAGNEKEGWRRMDLSHWVSLGSERIRGKFLEELIRRGEAKAAKRETELVLRACWTHDHHAGNVINQAARASALNKDFATAEACIQRSLMVLMRTPDLYFVEASAYLNVPHDMLIFRARARLAAGKFDDAMTLAREVLRVTPGHVEMVTGMVPELEKAGRKKDADELFAAAWGAYQKMLADHPDSPAARGALAALAAHTRRESDAGLKLAREALKADPQSAGFREVAAELHFLRGDRPEALKLMRKLADENPRSRLYRRQLARYTSAAFDSPWPEVEE